MMVSAGRSPRTGVMARRLAGMVIAVAVLAACQRERERERPLREVTLGLSWVHQAQFIGPYYADRHGLYAEQGLRATFVPASVDRDPLDEFLAGKYDFVIAQPDSLIIARQKGQRIKAVAVTYRIHPLVFMALASSNIQRPQDFRGKTIAVGYSNRLPLIAMLKKLQIDPSEVTLVQRDYGYDGLLKGDYDVVAGWRTNELLRARREGLALSVIAPYDHGITFYADVLVVRESLIEQEPALVEKFVRATMRGWDRALQNTADSAGLPLHYDPSLDMAHQRELLQASAPLVHTGIGQIGWMRTEHWETMIRTLYEEGSIPAQPRPEDVFTTRFLDPVGQP
jgi:NitT/TauT family transport system substrate-binding protein